MAKKGMAKSVVLLIIVIAGITGVFMYKRISARHSLAAQITALSPRGAPPQTIEDLRRAIVLYEKKIEEHVKDAAQTGAYWKILGSRLMDGRQPLHGEALKALENAARYYPEDETIHYLIGVSAESVARSLYFSTVEQAEHYRIAEAAYLRAIDIYGRYSKALFNLGVLYVDILNRPEEAIPHLESFMDINTRDINGMSVLAVARYMIEDYEGSIDLYNQIISITKDSNVKNQAEQNRQQVMDEWYR